MSNLLFNLRLIYTLLMFYDQIKIVRYNTSSIQKRRLMNPYVLHLFHIKNSAKLKPSL